MTKFISLTIAAAALLLILLGDTAQACSCMRNPTADWLLENADAIFTGTVEHSSEIDGHGSATTFIVSEHFKGARVGETVLVLHRHGSSASCGVNFEAGKSYTIAAHRSGERLTTSLCSTWMFLPHIGTSARLIAELRARRAR